MSPTPIEIIGADANNLHNVSASVHRHQINAIVGVSGSGKSSLVEDTLAAEGAHRMLGLLGIDARGPNSFPSRAFINALPPTLFVGQRAFRASSRTTVASATGLLRVLRRLFERSSTIIDRETGIAIDAPSSERYANWLVEHASGSVKVWAVPARLVATDGERAVRQLASAGMTEFTLRSETDRGKRAESGTVVAVARFKPLRADVKHTIEACVGEVELSKGRLRTLEHLLRAAWLAGDGHVVVELEPDQRPDLCGPFGPRLDSDLHWVHPDLPRVFSPPNRHLLSFNSPEHHESGACKHCKGIGRAQTILESALISQPKRSMHDGAFALWNEKNYRYVNIQHDTIEGLRGRDGFDPDVAWSKLSAKARDLILLGSHEPVADVDRRSKKKTSDPHSFPGFVPAILERISRGGKTAEALSPFVIEGPCPSCRGTRWSPAALALDVGGKSVADYLSMPFSKLAEATERDAHKGAADLQLRLAQIHKIASSLVAVGLGHLSGDRGMLEVSGGESRRTRLAGVLHSTLSDMLIILDEPARGLHEEDIDSIADELHKLAVDHTVVMSEHRQRLVARSEQLIELGPKAGPAGGRVQHSGATARSSWATAEALALADNTATDECWIRFEGASIHNITDAAVSVRVGAINVIAGVSGSGKSSFVRGVLVPGIASTLAAEHVDIDDFRTARGTWRTVDTANAVSSLLAIDQSAVTAQRRSYVASFLGLADTLRECFAMTPQAQSVGLRAADFGTNGGRGRCQRCLGLGTISGPTPCPVCGGQRFGSDVLAIRLEGWSILDALDLPISEIARSNLAPVLGATVLESVSELGVAHLSLGRSLDTLSGGEVQRLRIARALAKHPRRALVVLDEPAGGLHPSDVRTLHRALRHIVQERENTVVIVEHDLQLLAQADHVVEFGPSGGPLGGRVVASGTPKHISTLDTATGRALRGTVRAREPERSGATDDPTIEINSAVARSELRRLIGDDVEPVEVRDHVRSQIQAQPPSDAALEQPALSLFALDHEVAKLLIEGQHRARDTQRMSLIALWEERPTLTLVVHPCLDLLMQWGRSVPSSALVDSLRHAKAMGLTVVNPKEPDVRKLRARGERFAATTSAERERCVRDALAVGGGYVELVGDDLTAQSTLADRALDLERGLVGPRRLDPQHLCRTHSQGQCPTCKGRGSVRGIDPRCFLGTARGAVNDGSVLNADALAISKGLVRAEIVPFFTRLAGEGLWPKDARWSSLTEEQRFVLLYGCWIRPGHGTFLKDRSDVDGSEVGHWLRWDGLVKLVADQLHRSKNKRWAAETEKSERIETCLSCAGTGLSTAAELVTLQGRSWRSWQLEPWREFIAALQASTPPTARAEHTKRRLVEILAPLSDQPLPVGSCSLPRELVRSVLEIAARSLMGLTLMKEA